MRSARQRRPQPSSGARACATATSREWQRSARASPVDSRPAPSPAPARCPTPPGQRGRRRRRRCRRSRRRGSSAAACRAIPRRWRCPAGLLRLRAPRQAPLRDRAPAPARNERPTTPLVARWPGLRRRPSAAALQSGTSCCSLIRYRPFARDRDVLVPSLVYAFDAPSCLSSMCELLRGCGLAMRVRLAWLMQFRPRRQVSARRSTRSRPRPPCPPNRSANSSDGYRLATGLGTLSLARRRSDSGLDQGLREEGDSSPSSRARLTASARLCTPSLAYMLRRWALIVFSDTKSSAAISGPRRLVGR